jgi:hypothetical protein
MCHYAALSHSFNYSTEKKSNPIFSDYETPAHSPIGFFVDALNPIGEYTHKK